MDDTQDYAVKVANVSKSFKLPHEKQSSLKSALINFGSRGYEKQQVLNDVSFEIKKGEFFGIVGRNGSGKSTLLKLLAGIYTPDEGAIDIQGKLTPFIELGVGFNPELSGRDNVYLNGSLLGFSRKEMEAMYDDIVDFAELERFMDQKLKNYSSGMQVRLAFSIAIRANTDVLVLDEVLAVGDASFQQKCFDYFATLKSGHKTVILVSHSMPSIERFCDRAMLIENGSVVEIGPSAEVATLYERLFIDDVNTESKKDDSSKADDTKIDTGKSVNVGADITQDDKPVSAIIARRKFKVRVALTSELTVDKLNVGINIRNAQNQIVFSTDIHKHNLRLTFDKNKEVVVEFEIDNYYTNGKYSVDVSVVNEAGMSDKLLSRDLDVCSFEVIGIRDHVHSLFHPPVKVLIPEDDEK